MSLFKHVRLAPSTYIHIRLPKFRVTSIRAKVGGETLIMYGGAAASRREYDMLQIIVSTHDGAFAQPVSTRVIQLAYTLESVEQDAIFPKQPHTKHNQ